MKKIIPLAIPVMRGNEWRYVKECLDQGHVAAAGTYVQQLEAMIVERLGVRYAVCVANGTSALHLSLIVCGLSSDDAVIVPALTFIAPVNTVRYCGAEPIFMDCAADTLCLDIEKVVRYLESETRIGRDGSAYDKKNGRRIKAVIPVHVFGHPVDMAPLIKACGARSITVIEDATESLGSLYRGKAAGSIGRIGCLSFNGNKIITTGGGGAVATNEKALADHIRHLATQAKRGNIEYEHDEVGYNYRLSNIHAAIGVAQMEKIDEYVTVKRKNAELYRSMLSGVKGVEFIWEKPWTRSNFWFYTIKVPKKDKGPLARFLIERGVQVRPVWKPINRAPMYRRCLSYDVVNAPVAYETCLNLPCSVNLTESEIDKVVHLIKNYFNNR